MKPESNDEVLSYASQKLAGISAWSLNRFSAILLGLQAGIITFCEWEAHEFGRFVRLGTDRSAIHNVLRFEFSGGKVAQALLILAVANFIYVCVLLISAKRSTNSIWQLFVAIPLAVVPIVIQLVMGAFYAIIFE